MQRSTTYSAGRLSLREIAIASAGSAAICRAMRRASTRAWPGADDKVDKSWLMGLAGTHRLSHHHHGKCALVADRARNEDLSSGNSQAMMPNNG